MVGFSFTGDVSRLTEVYPQPNLLRSVLPKLSTSEKISFLQLWVTEGIPYAFKDLPVLYDAARVWLANQLGIHAKELTIIGSGRLGYSLCEKPEFGKPFGKDLDFSAVSASLFNTVVADFNLWKNDIDSGHLTPRTPKQHKYWPSSLDKLPKNICSGFIDPYKIPTLHKYQHVQGIQDALSRMCKKLEISTHKPKTTLVSLRVYRDWDAFVRQMELNLSDVVKSL